MLIYLTSHKSHNRFMWCVSYKVLNRPYSTNTNTAHKPAVVWCAGNSLVIFQRCLCALLFSFEASHTGERKPPLTWVINVATCYTCDNDEIWGPCTLGTPCSTVGTGHPVDSPVFGIKKNALNVWRNIFQWLKGFILHYLHEQTPMSYVFILI